MICKTILLVDDEKLIRWSLKKELEKSGYTILEAENAREALNICKEKVPDLILLDQILPDIAGLDILPEIQRIDPILPVIILTAVDKSRTAVQALKSGAFDYINKPVNLEELKVVIEKAYESTRLKRQVVHLIKDQQSTCGMFGLLGKSEGMRIVCDHIQKIAQSSGTTVLITGESGTGKELAAKAVHYLSNRRDNPFLPVNFSALTETLVESELFGHEKGAFTDAHFQKKGIFELANGGSILLDEIGDAPPSVQVKLLRVLEQKTIQRVGGVRELPVDVRIIAATNRPIEQLVKEGKFRSDLYYRLNVASIRMPPLRERGDDIITLAEFFLNEFNIAFHKNFKGLSEDTKKLFLAYDWPGNVRELRNVVERAVLMDDGEYILTHNVELGHLHKLYPKESSHEGKIETSGKSLDDMEKEIYSSKPLKRQNIINLKQHVY